VCGGAQQSLREGPDVEEILAEREREDPLPLTLVGVAMEGLQDPRLAGR
jgi:hypothetical protein